MKLNDVRRFSAYVSTIYHSEYITMQPAKYLKDYLLIYNFAHTNSVKLC